MKLASGDTGGLREGLGTFNEDTNPKRKFILGNTNALTYSHR